MAVSRLPRWRGIAQRNGVSAGLWGPLQLHNREHDELALARTERFLAYALVSSVAFVSVLSWFTPGTFIAAGDTPPFVRDSLLSELWSLWGHQITGSGSPSYEIARAADLLAISVSKTLGGGEPVAQMLLYVAVFVATGCAVSYFAFAFVKSWWAGAAAGLVAILNPFILQTLPDNIQPLAVIALMAASAGLIVRAAKGGRVRPSSLAWLSLGASWVASNPSLLAVLGMWIIMLLTAAALSGGDGHFRRAGLYVARATPPALLLNLWWLMPMLFTLANRGTGFAIGAETDVAEFQFFHARYSISNVVTLSSDWAWGQSAYYPYAIRLDGFPWGLLKSALPACALLSIVIARRERRRVALLAIVAVVVLTFLSKGLHEPGANVSLFLYEHVPGMWLFREPANKFGTGMVVLYGLLIGLALDGAVYRWRARESLRTQVTVGVVVGLTLAAVLYPYPIWTGEVIPSDRRVLPSAHVALPDAWRSIADTIDSSSVRGKVLVLPLNEGYYQLGTSWGYYGGDLIPRWLLTRATFQPTPEGYFAELPAVNAMLTRLESRIKAGDNNVRHLLEALGISHIVLRHDTKLFPWSHGWIKSDAPLAAELTKSENFDLVSRNDVASLYEITYGASGLLRSNDVSSLSWQRVDPSSYEVELPASDSDFDLFLSESFAEGWQIQDLDEDRTLGHFRANGYANGWRIRAGPRQHVTVTYGPQLLFSVAVVISLMTALIAVVVRLSQPRSPLPRMVEMFRALWVRFKRQRQAAGQ